MVQPKEDSLRDKTRKKIQNIPNAQSENQKLLMEEYKIIQSKIDQYGNSFNVLKGFAIAFTGSFLIFSANFTDINSLELLIPAFLVLYIMYLEIQNRAYFDKLINRALEIENKYHINKKIRPIEILRIGRDLTQIHFNFHLLKKVHNNHLPQLLIYYILIMIILYAKLDFSKYDFYYTLSKYAF